VLQAETLMPVIGFPDRLKTTESRLKETGIQVLDLEFFWINADTKIADFEPYVEAGARLGARNVLTGANDPDRNRFIDHWLEMCDLAAKYRMRAHLEFMPFPDMATINTYAQAIELMKTAPHPNAGVMIDAMHFDRSGSQISEIRPEHYAYMAYTQLCDAPAGRPSLEEMERQARADRLPPGRGGLNLIGLLKALPPTQPLALEVPLGGDAQRWTHLQKAQHVFNATQDFLHRLETPAAA